MTFALPDFSGTRCHSLSFCGSVESESAGLPPGFSKDSGWEYGQYKSRSKTVRVRLGRGKPHQPERGHHLHIDFGTLGWDALAGEKPTEVLSRQDLQAILAGLAGLEYSPRVRAVFDATRAELPPFIEYNARPVKSGEVELEMRSGYYAVRGAPVYGVYWTASPDGDRFAIELFARVSRRPFDPELIADALTLCEGAFGVIIRPERVDG